MPVVVVMGAQWGDEGKGKFVDLLAEKAHVVVRSTGGSNAGHTVWAGGKQYKLHQVPSGILYPGRSVSSATVWCWIRPSCWRRWTGWRARA